MEEARSRSYTDKPRESHATGSSARSGWRLPRTVGSGTLSSACLFCSSVQAPNGMDCVSQRRELLCAAHGQQTMLPLVGRRFRAAESRAAGLASSASRNRCRPRGSKQTPTKSDVKEGEEKARQAQTKDRSTSRSREQWVEVVERGCEKWMLVCRRCCCRCRC